MIFHIQSFQNAGPVKLRMPRDEVRKILASQPISLASKARSTTPSDIFQKLGVHVHYDEDALCEAIELFAPAAPIFQGQYLFNKPFKHLEQWIMAQDQSAQFDGSGIESNKLGIGIYAPAGQEKPYDPPEGVIIFEKGYYDKPMKR